MLKNRVVTTLLRLVVTGTPIELGATQAVGITVDNYSNNWLTIGKEGLFVPPFTAGWANNLYSSSASSLLITAQAPAGATQPPVNIDGLIVIAAYDDLVIPNPGFSTQGSQNTPYSVAGIAFTGIQPVDGENVGIVAKAGRFNGVVTLPVFYANGMGLESFAHIQARQLTTHRSGRTAVLAAALTNTGFATTANEGRVMYCWASTSAAGYVEIFHAAIGTIWGGDLLAGTPGPVQHFGVNGLSLGGVGNFQVRCSAAANIAWNIGISPS